MADLFGLSLLAIGAILLTWGFDFEGHRMTPYYCNNYIANGGVVAPIFGIPEDRQALETLRSVYPEREVVGIKAGFLEVGGGAAHCITQQRPKGRTIPL